MGTLGSKSFGRTAQRLSCNLDSQSIVFFVSKLIKIYGISPPQNYVDYYYVMLYCILEKV